MSDQLNIRPARRGDGEGLAALWFDMCEYYAGINPEVFQLPRSGGLVESFEDDLGKDLSEDTVSLVAEANGRVVGWIRAVLVAPREDARFQLLRELGETRLVVESLVVLRSMWRQGVGTKLLRSVEDWGRKRDAVLSNVDTYSDSPVSVPFYEHGMGYTRRSIRFQKQLK